MKWKGLAGIFNYVMWGEYNNYIHDQFMTINNQSLAILDLRLRYDKLKEEFEKSKTEVKDGSKVQ
jgi:hypothetical protein